MVAQDFEHCFSLFQIRVRDRIGGVTAVLERTPWQEVGMNNEERERKLAKATRSIPAGAHEAYNS